MLVATLVGCGRDISGQYRTKFADGVGWLQLVETDDHHLTGQLETVPLGTGGQIITATMVTTGAVNGSEVTLTLMSPVPLTPAILVGGTGFSSDMGDENGASDA